MTKDNKIIPVDEQRKIKNKKGKIRCPSTRMIKLKMLAVLLLHHNSEIERTKGDGKEIA